MTRVTLLLLLLLSAFGLRVLYDKNLGPDNRPAALRIPLGDFPMDAVGPGWKGEDVPLDKETESLARVTSYLQRVYTQEGKQLWFYVGYVAGSAPEAVHHPAVCFPANGLELDHEEIVSIPMPSVNRGCRFKEFLWRSSLGGGTYTLSTFYYQGKFEPDEWKLRSDRILGMRYFAVITISGTTWGSLKEMRDVYFGIVGKAIPRLLGHFPESPEESSEKPRR